MSYGLNFDTRQVLDAQRSRLHRQEGQIASLQLELDEKDRQIADIKAGLVELRQECDRRCKEEFGAASGGASLLLADVEALVESVTGGKS